MEKLEAQPARCDRQSALDFHVLLFELLEGFDEVDGEAGGGGAIDDAMIVGESDWQHQPWLDVFVAHDGLEGATAQAEDGDLRFINDRSKMGSADAALVGNGEGAAF